jgi:phosphoribosyl 1,2-cyclic phosphodiesterase
VQRDSALTISSLGSGSNGNAFLIEYGDQRVLVDAGVPIRTLTRCLELRGIKPQDLTAALISHEHSDHIRALPSLMKKGNFPVFATRGTHAGIHEIADRDRQFVQRLVPFRVGDIEVTPIPVQHDAREPVGFSIDVEGVIVTVMSDLGEATEVNAEFAAKADHLIIESNYDEGMLRSGSYPAYLKQRIRSSDGHLGNDDCAEFLKDVVRRRTGSIWLCHLSENNNHPQLAVEATSRVLTGAGIFRRVSALPRYDGTVTTWSASDRPEIIEQSTLPF